MTPRERMVTAMLNGRPDMVPVAPDMSNMIPCKLTGKPFWDIYLYNDPPLWKAYAGAVRHFGFDGWSLVGYDLTTPAKVDAETGSRETVIVYRNDDRIITREYVTKDNRKEWSRFINVYYRSDPPTHTLAEKLGMADPPTDYTPIEGIKEQRTGLDFIREVKEDMGEAGAIGYTTWAPCLGLPGIDPYSIYEYTDDPNEVKAWAEAEHERIITSLKSVLAAEVKPDFVLLGNSGMLVFNTMSIIRDISLPTIKEISRLCKAAGIPSQIHCCGPERELIRMCAEETDISSMNPLESHPMGDCSLLEIKQAFGHKISLMGNLHTTEVMLFGSPDDVIRASRQAIEDAAEGGGFILSTGDQCGRDTPEENIRAMLETARTYGQY